MKKMPATQVAGIFIMTFLRGDSRDQGALFPVSLDELVPEDHVCRVIDAFVGSLDLVQLGFSKALPAATGRPAYDPADLLKLYLYGYLQQVRSSRRLERECQRNVELMWLLNRLAPDHKTIAEFRRREGAALRAVAAAFVRFCRGQGLIRGEWLAIDGAAVREALEQPTLNVVADAGYSNGAQAEALEVQGITAHVPANRAVNNQGDGALFDRRSFSYDEATDTMRCPAGQTLRRKQLHRKDRMVIYAAEIGACGTCVLKARCTVSPRRLVTRHLHEAARQRMHARATPELMRLRRCVVEHPFASLKYRIFEKPRFLLRGRWGAGTEMSLATLVWNLKRAMSVIGSAALAERLAYA